MKITCNHPSSSYGIPVILDGNGNVMDYGAGLTAALKALGWSRAEFASQCGYKGPRSVEKFWQGVVPPAKPLNILGVALELHQADSPERRAFESWYLTEYPDGSVLRETLDRTRYLDERTRVCWETWRQAKLRNS